MRPRPIALILTLALSLLGAPLPAMAQQTTKIPRVGYLQQAHRSGAPDYYEAFWQGLHELGYVEGQNIALEYRAAEGKLERLPELAQELVRLNVDLIVTVGTADALAAKNATRTIPIVTVLVADPVQLGLVASLARPGGNITGLTSVGLEITAKQLELLKETVPKASRVAVLRNPAFVVHTVALKDLEVAARSLGVQLQVVEARGPDEFDRAFAAMRKARVGALLVLADGMFLLHRTRIADLAAKHHLPALYGLRQHAEAGGLMAYSAKYIDLFRRAAAYVDKILKGAKPADLPVEQPTRFELVVNLKTAKALGVTIPASVLIRADKVIE